MRHLPGCLSCGLGIVLLLGSAARADLPAEADLRITLGNAAWPTGAPDRKAEVRLRLLRAEGQWNPFVLVGAINAAAHDGWIVESTSAGADHTLRLRVRFRSDKWFDESGGAEYALRFTVDGRKCAGTWTGSVRGTAAEGTLTGEVEPLRRLPGFRPPAADEHPRLLVRKSELPALKARAQSEWGKPWLERLQKDTRNPVAQGLAYALTGQVEHARNVQAKIERTLAGQEWYHIGTAAHYPAFVAVEHLIGYDLVHDACDEAFRRRFHRFLSDKMEFFYWGTHNSQYNGAPTSNWSLMYRSGGGLIGLTLLHEPWQEPPASPKPELARLTPPKDTPTEEAGAWRYAWPVDEGWDQTTDPAKLTYAPVPAAVLKNGTLDLAALTKRTYCKGLYLATTLKVAEAGHYRLTTTRHGKSLRYQQATLAGQRMASGDCVHLAPGLYPLRVRLWPEPVGNWEPLDFSARIEPVSDELAANWFKERSGGWEAERKALDAQRSAARTLGCNPQALYWAQAAAGSAEGYFRRGLGDFGWNQEGEAYTRHAVRAAMPFALCYRNTFGQDIPGAERLGLILALSTAATIYSDRSAAMQTYNVGGGPMDVDLFARGWPFVPERHQPAVLWSWNRSLALAQAGKLTDPHRPIATHDGLSAAMMLLSYPVDAREQNPGEVLDRVTIDKQKGGYIFRNRWQDGDDCVVSLFANDGRPGGTWTSCEGGTFRINALGAAFAVRGQSFGNGASGRSLKDYSLYQNLVDVGEHDMFGTPPAPTTHLETQKDGSGVVSLNMDEVYQHADKQEVPRGKSTEWKVIGKKDLGIRGVRSFAVDYSGLSGAPCLVAVADHLTGTQGRNTWQMATERAHTVTCEGNTFTIAAAGGATLRGTVVLPAGAAVRSVEAEHRHEINYHGGHRGAVFQQRVILVDGKDKDQQFLVLMTVQRGDAPAVRVADGKAQVGGRIVSFDGRKLLLEQAKP